MLLRTEAFPVFLSFLKMSQGHVIDIMTYNSYSLQYYSFWKAKVRGTDFLLPRKSVKIVILSTNYQDIFVTLP